MISMYIKGTPEAKGSVSAFPIKRGKKYGAVVTHSSKSKRWEKEIKNQCDYAGEVLDCPLKVELHFKLPKPKTVKREFPSVEPDLDKLIRAVLDALTGIVFKNDSRVVLISAMKSYAVSGAEGVYIEVDRYR